jgi:hypothetical protein
VGGAETFHVHKDVLNQSPFFNNALKPEWTAMRDGRPIEIPDHMPVIFEMYDKWLYSHVLVETTNTIALAHMYVLGEEMLDTHFQDAVISAIMSNCATHSIYPVGAQIDIIYTGTTATSPARKLLVDFFLHAGGKEWVLDRDHASNRPADFVNDLLTALMDRSRQPSESLPWITNPAAYFLNGKTTENEDMTT